MLLGPPDLAGLLTGVPSRLLPKASQRGFTLLELAIVIAVIGLLLGGILLPLASQIELRRINDVHDQLEYVKDALIGYAIANGRLPCPDTDRDADGIENAPCSGGVEGNLPYASLGIDRRDDAWGRVLRYRSDDKFNDISGIPFPPDTEKTSEDGMQVHDRHGDGLTNTSALETNNPVAIIFSCGKNGIPDSENDPDLIADGNADCGGGISATPNNTYMQDVPTEGGFDDLLVWLSRSILIARITAAGTWP